MPSAERRECMCHSVFSSVYFDMLGQEPLNVNEAYTELRTKRPNIFEKLNFESELTNVIDVRKIDDVMVFFGTEIHQTSEYIWTCVTRHRETKEISVYFISDEYNVAVNAFFAYYSGHFILHPNANGEITRVLAMVEDVPDYVETKRKIIEKKYLEYREYYPLGKCEYQIIELHFIHRQHSLIVLMGFSSGERRNRSFVSTSGVAQNSSLQCGFEFVLPQIYS